MNEIPASETANLERRAFQEELDVAIDQLPARYRQPLQMFHLEGRSLEVISQTLGLNLNTVSTRLARARELLRQKLVRRGITVGSVGALTALLSAESGAAVLPPTFIASTISAATGGTVSSTVVALTQGAISAMSIATAKTAAIVAGAAVIVTGAALWISHQNQQPASVPTTAVTKEAAPRQPQVTGPSRTATRRGALPESPPAHVSRPLPDSVPALQSERSVVSSRPEPATGVPSAKHPNVRVAGTLSPVQEQIVDQIAALGDEVVPLMRIFNEQTEKLLAADPQVQTAKDAVIDAQKQWIAYAKQFSQTTMAGAPNQTIQTALQRDPQAQQLKADWDAATQAWSDAQITARARIKAELEADAPVEARRQIDLLMEISRLAGGAGLNCVVTDQHMSISPKGQTIQPQDAAQAAKDAATANRSVPQP